MGLLKKVITDKVRKDDEFIKIVKASDDGEQWAKKELNVLFQKNEPGLIKRINEARIYIYKDDAYRGVPKAQYYYGLSLQGLKNDESLRMLVPLAEKGNVDAMKAIASGYGEKYGRYGYNPIEYMKWHTMAAETGDISSQNIVALQYIIKKDYVNAFHWYSESAKKNSSEGYCGLAKCYEYKKMQLYSKSSKPSQKEIENVENKIEECYLQALQYVSNQEEDEKACFGIAGYYRGISYSIINNEKKLFVLKLAIYYYTAAYQCGNPYAIKNAEEISDQYNINVNFNDIEAWATAERLFD